MTAFSSGKNANGTCDRCGFVYKLHSLKALTVNESLTNLLVCEECWEEDHPQYRAGKLHVVDPQAVENARADTPSGED